MYRFLLGIACLLSPARTTEKSNHSYIGYAGAKTKNGEAVPKTQFFLQWLRNIEFTPDPELPGKFIDL